MAAWGKSVALAGNLCEYSLFLPHMFHCHNPGTKRFCSAPTWSGHFKIQAHARLKADATWTKTKLSHRPARRRPSLVLAAHLDLKAIWILDVETAGGLPHLQPPAFQLRSDRILYFLVRVPVGDGVSDMIDALRVGRPATRITDHKERFAHRQTALLSVVPRNLHSEQIRIEVASLRVIGHLIRNMVDVNGLGYFAIGRSYRRCARGRDRCRQGQALNKLSPGHLSLFEVLKKFRHDVFHCVSSFLKSKFCIVHPDKRRVRIFCSANAGVWQVLLGTEGIEFWPPAGHLAQPYDSLRTSANTVLCQVKTMPSPLSLRIGP